MIHVDLLRQEHKDGNRIYPIFVGFIDAATLDRIAEAPHFELKTPHERIASNISESPVREWQRPRDDDRVKEIARIYRSSHEIMPNAVLLAAHRKELVNLESLGASNFWRLSVSEDLQERPLWILDGQHRIAGLTEANRTTALPFVLLASHGMSADYQESTFAKIFAQVTTTAEGLNKLHNEWLTYAFHLGKYDETAPADGMKNAKHRLAMEASIDLCRLRQVDPSANQSNPFFDRVAFNPGSVRHNEPAPVVGPSSGGFQFDSIMMEDHIFRSYFNASLQQSPLDPADVAREVGKAYEALLACHTASERSRSVLLGDTHKGGNGLGHKALQDAFVHGVLRYLAHHGTPSSWEEVLEDRAFKSTTWDPDRWQGDRQGKQGTINKKIAHRVFDALFSKDLEALFAFHAAKPTSVDLRDYLLGDIGWGFSLKGRRKSGKSIVRFDPTTDPSINVTAGQALSNINLGDHRYLKIDATDVAPSIVAVDIIDKDRPTSGKWSWRKLQSGFSLDGNLLHTNPVELIIVVTFYGGEKRETRIRLRK